jgi:hypothetical protein
VKKAAAQRFQALETSATKLEHKLAGLALLFPSSQHYFLSPCPRRGRLPDAFERKFQFSSLSQCLCREKGLSQRRDTETKKIDTERQTIPKRAF